MRYSKYKAYILGLSLLLAPSLLLSKSYFKDQDRGWLWGEEKPIEEPKKEEEEEPKKEVILDGYIEVNGKKYKTIQTKTDIPWSIIDKLDPDEVIELETQTKKISVMYPTQENLLEYKRLQKYITDKATGFMEVSHFASMQDSEMAKWVSDTSMNSTFTRSTKRVVRRDSQSKELLKHKDKMIILVATLPGCPYCEEQIPLMQRFESEYGIEFKEVDISKKQGFAKKYDIQTTPDLFLLYKNDVGEPQMTRFGSGLQTIEDLKNGVLAGLYTFGKISKDLLEF
ncbi:MAG: conjugal transfer protein TraF [Sulfurimonadaceae bacterium]|jgi:conjugal transfer pilus assembly protein TraF|nr:conjugal transfer protein TraF [Sulfurimonadaceae bacterium]